MADGKAAEKERVPDNFDDVIGCEEEKEKGDHHADTPGLAGSDVKKARQSACQRKVIHRLIVLVFYRNVNATPFPFYGASPAQAKLHSPASGRGGRGEPRRALGCHTTKGTRARPTYASELSKLILSRDGKQAAFARTRRLHASEIAGEVQPIVDEPLQLPVETGQPL